MRARDNPFRVERVLRFRYRFPEGGWEKVLARLCELDFRGAIVGEEGSGKTTLLEDLAGRSAQNGFGVRFAMVSAGQRHLSAEQRRLLFEDAGPADILFIDGADALAGLAWRRIRRASRRARGLVVTSHREGLLPTLHRTATSPLLLSEMVRSLAGAETSSFGISDEELYQRHGGNLRAAVRELYDRCADNNLYIVSADCVVEMQGVEG